MSKTNHEAEHDLSLDIADTVGRTVGNIVNRIEALDQERSDLIAKLADARASLNAQFNKWLPATLTTATAGRPSRARGTRGPKPGAACQICGFATEPYHDGRLKAHRDQGDDKKALSDHQMDSAGLTRL